jgi:hypothetical protein
MKKLLTILAGALAIVWIAVPVAGAADVYGHAKPADVYASTHPDPYDSVGLRHPDPSGSSDAVWHPDPWLSTGLRPSADVYASSWSALRPGASAGWTSLRPHDVYQSSSWNRIRLTDVSERG